MNTFVFPIEEALDSLFRKHSGDPLQHGWRIKMQYRFRYFPPEAWYQAVVDQIVTDECRWIDVGGGKSIFPDNHKLSRELAERCDHLVGVDPSDNLDQNDLVDERCKATIEQYHSDEVFDLATLRMVAEHIEQPEMVVQSLARLIKPTGYVVIYTPNRWSFLSAMASLIPNSLHAFLARLLAPDREDEDIFPTCYKMNTRRRLRNLFKEGGFREVGFAYLDDTSILQRFRVTCFLELALRKVFHLLRVRYPENNLLGIYQKQ